MKNQQPESLGERVAAIEATCGVVREENERRIGDIEKTMQDILKEVVEVKTMLENNGIKKQGNGKPTNSEVRMAKMETKFSRYMFALVSINATMILGMLAVVAMFFKMR